MSEADHTSPQQDLEDILHHTQPRSLLYAGEGLSPLVEKWRRENPGTLTEALPREAPHKAFPLSRLYDLALVADTLEHLSGADGRLLLGQLRNMGAQRMAVLDPVDSPWRFRDFIGLGFVRQQCYDQQGGLTLYTYDIASYNHKRTWNNPQNWANPEMWDKARW
ncbi:MAG: DUF6231 family protein [Oleiphilaceae bacterium]|nr:DUF6231 family protein [Oleiphilaceae bacterium]